MDGIASIGGVGAVTSQARIPVVSQSRSLKDQPAVTEGTGSAALKLILDATVSSPAPEHDLDVTA